MKPLPRATLNHATGSLMADHNPSPLPPAAADSSLFSPLDRDNVQRGRAKVAELDKYQSEMSSMLQGLRQDIQNWTSEMGTQANVCQDDISELKRRLNSELNQMRPSSAAPEISTEIEEQGKETAKKAQASTQEGMDQNEISVVRWQMMLGKLKALATRSQD